ncbi:MAG: outer-membrane lipoprotein carrier protein LolA [Bacilli bacterium]|nr:outer-membrane lipoprotein carrier protein LolA [Bacilli bacterium]MDD3895740.1 outer-membrane lipoprotein carrier protein LolA [Bacilli bacterium]MDD4408112.1 outer-membrane lipoprotein carrier protein LolA [Bacilli bacterium]
MKKYIVLFISLFLLLTGCGKGDTNNVKEDFVKNIDKRNSYLIKGTMNIISNEDNFSYNITAAKSKDYYRVNLVNTINNHEQVILKSEEGVYVITPSLNKSFKFQSEWPDNGSQAYLLNSLVDDIKTDAESKAEKSENGFIITAKVNYPNNANLVSEKIYVDDKREIQKVEVLDSSGNIKITVKFTSIDYKPSFKDDYFKLESLIDDECCEEDEETSKIIEDIIYPLYLPTNTYLSSKNTINTDVGNRVILTFTGESPFTLIEEVATPKTEFEIIPVYGEPLMLNDTFGALSANSLYWTSNNIDYYISSEKLSSTELLTIAESISSGSLTVAGEK